MSMSISPINAAASWLTPEVSQSVTNSQSTSTSTPNASNLAGVFQQFSVDLQSMLAQAQASQAATGTGTTTASNATLSPSNSTGQPTAQQPGGVQHHHHHHHGGGSAQSAANQFVSQIAQLVEGGSASASANSSPTTGSALAADIVQALQSYGAFGSQQATSTVSTTA
jgi:hypothetical protein